MALPIYALFVATFLFFWYLRKGRKDEESRRKGLKSIPGPRSLPIIGNIHQLSEPPHKQWTKWAKEYGDIYQVYIGSRPMVIISDPKLVKEVYSADPAFAGRPYFEGFDVYLEHPKMGIVNAEGDLWEQHRRFLLRQLRDFGFGKSAMETLIMDELLETIQRLKLKQGKSVGAIKDTFRIAVVNSLWNILSSERFSQDDPKLLDLIVKTLASFNDGQLFGLMPWLRHIAPGFSGYTNLRSTIDENEVFFRETIERHKKNLQEDDLKDFIDVYLAEVKKTTDPTSHFYGDMAEKQLVSVLFDLFLAGSDTTSSTLSWTVLYLCMFPEAQEKLQKEIEEVTGGNSRNVFVADRSSMPYTLALIDEILRYSSIVPDGVMHSSMADREFHGYFIPKDTMIQPNLYYIHHNPKIWGDPEKFRPERFLTETKDGEKKYTRNDNLQAFQVGRRQCVGESLARDTIFLFITNLFQQFSMKFDENKEKPSTEAEKGFIREPLPYWVIMKDRLKK